MLLLGEEVTDVLVPPTALSDELRLAGCSPKSALSAPLSSGGSCSETAPMQTLQRAVQTQRRSTASTSQGSQQRRPQ